MDDHSEYYNEVQKYYELKNEMDRNIVKVKSKLRNKIADGKIKYNKLDFKRENIMKNVKCPYCKKKGGLMFIETPETLTAQCNAIGEKCEFKLIIERKVFDNIEETIKNYQEEKNNLVEQINYNKLQYIFGFINEDEVSKTLKEVQESYSESEKMIDFLTKISENLYPEEETAKEIDSQKSLLNEMKNDILQLVKEGVSNSNQGLINEAIQKYKDELIPGFDKHNKTKYFTYEMKDIIPIKDDSIINTNEDKIVELKKVEKKKEQLEFAY